jgi:cell division protein FtsQ
MIKLLQRRQLLPKMAVEKTCWFAFSHRFWHYLLWMLCISLFLWGWVTLRDPETVPIETVNIAGDYQHIDSKQLQQLVLPYVATGFFSVNLVALKDRLLEVPWVADATISRVWPHTINVTIVEQKASAIWNNYSLINEKGVVFSPPRTTFSFDLPNFYGPIGQQEAVLKNYWVMQNIVKRLGLKILVLQLSPRRAWRLRLSNNVIVVLGQTDVVARLNRLVAIYPKIIGNHSDQVNYVDVRYGNGLAVAWKPETSNLPA